MASFVGKKVPFFLKLMFSAPYYCHMLLFQVNLQVSQELHLIELFSSFLMFFNIINKMLTGHIVYS